MIVVYVCVQAQVQVQDRVHWVCGRTTAAFLLMCMLFPLHLFPLHHACCLLRMRPVVMLVLVRV